MMAMMTMLSSLPTFRGLQSRDPVPIQDKEGKRDKMWRGAIFICGLWKGQRQGSRVCTEIWNKYHLMDKALFIYFLPRQSCCDHDINGIVDECFRLLKEKWHLECMHRRQFPSLERAMLDSGAYMVLKNVNKHLHLEICRKKKEALSRIKNEALDHEISCTNDVEECAAAVIWLFVARCALRIIHPQLCPLLAPQSLGPNTILREDICARRSVWLA